ncbi:MAG: glutamate formimidoyltransferase [Bacteroidales bacterium]|nr:glutamate formimidoyltransferase [Bacteroidales bacterium]
MAATVECVPNFSEGRDKSVIEAISGSIGAAGCKVLHTDIGYDTNRTVITFAGEASNVAEAAFAAVKRASELIDMRYHTGTHPRQGATDVLPLVPVSGISMAECADMARSLAARIYGELGIPCYCYGEAAFTPERKRLEVCREGEYEALEAKIADNKRRPDFCGESFTLQAARSGATTVGARDFLIAVNFNLDTDDVAVAKAIALDVRARGHNGIAGLLPGCKAIGWYIPEYGFAQVSMNITDISLTPLHVAYETVSAQAALRGLHVTGTEIIGLVPKRVLLAAGAHFWQSETSNPEILNSNRLQAIAKRVWADSRMASAERRGLGQRPSIIGREFGLHARPLPADNHLISLAIKKMGLNTIRPYNVKERVLEYLL